MSTRRKPLVGALLAATGFVLAIFVAVSFFDWGPLGLKYRSAAMVVRCTVTGACGHMGSLDFTYSHAGTGSLILFALLNPALLIGYAFAERGHLIKSLAKALPPLLIGICGSYFLVNLIFKVLRSRGFTSHPYPLFHADALHSWILFAVLAFPVLLVGTYLGEMKRK